MFFHLNVFWHVHSDLTVRKILVTRGALNGFSSVYSDMFRLASSEKIATTGAI